MTIPYRPEPNPYEQLLEDQPEEANPYEQFLVEEPPPKPPSGFRSINPSGPRKTPKVEKARTPTADAGPPLIADTSQLRATPGGAMGKAGLTRGGANPLTGANPFSPEAIAERMAKRRQAVLEGEQAGQDVFATREQDPGMFRIAARGVKQALGGTVKETGQVAEMFGAERAGRAMMRYGAQVAAANPTPVEQLADVHSAGDLAKWAVGGAGKAVGYFGPMALTGGAAATGAKLAGAALPAIEAAGTAGAFASSMALGTGENRSEMDELGNAQGGRDLLALAGGAAIGALDVITPSRVMSRLLKPTTSPVSAVTHGLVRRLGKAAGEAVVSEAATEAVQEAITYGVARAGTDAPIELKELGGRMIEAAAQGAIGGALLGGGESAVQGAREYARRKAEAREQRQMDEAQARFNAGVEVAGALDSQREVPLEGVGQQPPAPAGPGRPHTVTFSNGQKVGARYALVEADQLQSSHDPFSFQPNPNFPPEAQGRDYGADATAQQLVKERAQQLDPDLALDPSQTPDKGPPIIREDGTVIAGNERSMLVRRAAELAPARYEAYRNALNDRAAEYGIDPEELARMNRPILVRVAQSSEGLDLSNVETLRQLNRASDMPDTKTMRWQDAATSRAKQLQAATGALTHFATTLEGEESLADYLSRKDGQEFVRKLVEDGVLTQAEMANVATNGVLHDEGKLAIRRLLLAATVENSQTLDLAPKGVLNNIEAAVPHLVAASTVAEYDLTPILTDALGLLGEAQQRGMKLEELLSQQSMFEGNAPMPEAVALARFLNKAKKTEITERLRKYATLARESVSRGENDMFGGMAPTPAQAFAELTAKPTRAKGKKKAKPEVAEEEGGEIPPVDALPTATLEDGPYANEDNAPALYKAAVDELLSLDDAKWQAMSVAQKAAALAADPRGTEEQQATRKKKAEAARAAAETAKQAYVQKREEIARAFGPEWGLHAEQLVTSEAGPPWQGEHTVVKQEEKEDGLVARTAKLKEPVFDESGVLAHTDERAKTPQSRAAATRAIKAGKTKAKTVEAYQAERRAEIEKGLRKDYEAAVKEREAVLAELERHNLSNADWNLVIEALNSVKKGYGRELLTELGLTEGFRENGRDRNPALGPVRRAFLKARAELLARGEGGRGTNDVYDKAQAELQRVVRPYSAITMWEAEHAPLEDVRQLLILDQTRRVILGDTPIGKELVRRLTKRLKAEGIEDVQSWVAEAEAEAEAEGPKVPESLPPEPTGEAGLEEMGQGTVFGSPLARRFGQEELFGPEVREAPGGQKEMFLEGEEQGAAPEAATSTTPPQGKAYEREFVEPVPVSTLMRFREFQREPSPELVASIQARGIDEPLILSYWPKARRALLTEGNHRLFAAAQLNLENVPVTVIRLEGSNVPDAALKVPGIEPNQHGYVPGNLRPSDIGIGRAPQMRGAITEEEIRQRPEAIQSEELAGEDTEALPGQQTLLSPIAVDAAQMPVGSPVSPVNRPDHSASMLRKLFGIVAGNTQKALTERRIARKLARAVIGLMPGGPTAIYEGGRRMGKAKWGAAGYFRLFGEGIRVHRLNHIGTVAHEFGHFISKTWFGWPTRTQKSRNQMERVARPPLTLSKASVEELNAAGKRLYGDRKPAAGYGEEGIAEALKFFVTDPTRLKQEMPTFAAQLEELFAANPELAAPWQAAQAEYQAYLLLPALERMMGKITVNPDWKNPVNGDELIRLLADDDWDFRKAVRELVEAGGKVTAQTNPLLLRRLYNGAGGRAMSIIKHGFPVISVEETVTKKGGIKKQPKLQYATRALKNALDQIPREEAMQFRAYIAGMSALDRYAMALTKLKGRKNASPGDRGEVRDHADVLALDPQSRAALEFEYKKIMKGGGYGDVGFTIQEAEEAIKYGDARNWRAIAEIGWENEQAVVDSYVQAGLLTYDQGEAIKEFHPHHVSFERDLSEEEGAPSGATGGSGAVMRKQSGGGANILDPLAGWVKNIYDSQRNIARHRAIQALVQLAVNTEGGDRVMTVIENPMEHIRTRLGQLKPAQVIDALEELGLELPKDPATGETLEWPELRKWLESHGDIAFDIFQRVRAPRRIEQQDMVIMTVHNGQKTWMQIAPRHRALYESLTATDPNEVNRLLYLVGAPTRALRIGATSTFEFGVANLFRDVGTAATYTRARYRIPLANGKEVMIPGAQVLVAFGRMMGGLQHLYKQDMWTQLFQLSGGDLASLTLTDRKGLRAMVDELMAERGKFPLTAYFVRHPIEFARLIGSVTEQANRIGEYKAVMEQSLKAGHSLPDALVKSGYASREVTQDFARMGAWVRVANQLSPFLGARVGGVAKAIEELGMPIQPEMRTSLVNENVGKWDRAQEAWLHIAAAITLPSLVLLAIQYDDDRYKNIPRWVKMIAWPILIPGTDLYVAIPKPPGIGQLFGTIPELLVESMLNGGHFSAAQKDQIKQALSQELLPFSATEVMPFKPLLENKANYSFFFQGTIEPVGRSQLPAEERYRKNTSDFLIAISQSPLGEWLRNDQGEGVLASPAKLENVAVGYGGGLAKYPLAAADVVTRATRAALGKPALKAPISQERNVLTQLPAVKRLIKAAPELDAAPVAEFYDRWRTAEQHRKAWQLKPRGPSRSTYLAEHPDIRLVLTEEDAKAAGLGVGRWRSTYTEITKLQSEIRQLEKRDSPRAASERKRKIQKVQTLTQQALSRAK